MSATLQHPNRSSDRSNENPARESSANGAQVFQEWIAEKLPLVILLVLAAGLVLYASVTGTSLPNELYKAGSILLSLTIIHHLRNTNGRNA